MMSRAVPTSGDSHFMGGQFVGYKRSDPGSGGSESPADPRKRVKVEAMSVSSASPVSASGMTGPSGAHGAMGAQQSQGLSGGGGGGGGGMAHFPGAVDLTSPTQAWNWPAAGSGQIVLLDSNGSIIIPSTQSLGVTQSAMNLNGMNVRGHGGSMSTMALNPAGPGRIHAVQYTSGMSVPMTMQSQGVDLSQGTGATMMPMQSHYIGQLSGAQDGMMRLPQQVVFSQAPDMVDSVSLTQAAGLGVSQGQSWGADFRMTMAETRRMANFVVDWCLMQGELPMFGKEAENLILNLTPVEVSRAEDAGLAGEGEMRRWRKVLSTCDPGTALVEQRRRRGASKQTPLRSLMNVKVSEHWSYKAKLLFKKLDVREKEGPPMGREEVTQGWVICGISVWTGIDIQELNTEHITLALWRANKRIEGRSLRDDVQAARRRVRGRRVEVSEFDLAREGWRAELDALKQRLFPNGDRSALETGRELALKEDGKDRGRGARSRATATRNRPLVRSESSSSMVRERDDSKSSNSDTSLDSSNGAPVAETRGSDERLPSQPSVSAPLRIRGPPSADVRPSFGFSGLDDEKDGEGQGIESPGMIRGRPISQSAKRGGPDLPGIRAPHRLTPFDGVTPRTGFTPDAKLDKETSHWFSQIHTGLTPGGANEGLMGSFSPSVPEGLLSLGSARDEDKRSPDLDLSGLSDGSPFSFGMRRSTGLRMPGTGFTPRTPFSPNLA